ncbi:signal peptidase I [Lacticaseibacillus camelliae]|uniref:signal peptidase I n=1 Tax=Lacticaseibacillus camelliae TaxID=381742 RepID=UPI0006D27E39|nr:signal peptidase I [Lacticaseibacillus camelliae]
MSVSKPKNKHRIVSWLCNLALLIAFGLLLLTGINRLFYNQASGTLSFRVVQSGSMAPRMPVGSLIVTRSVDPHEIRPGDIISTNVDGTVLTHRVVAIPKRSGDIRFETKGDANTYEDTRLTSCANVLGKLMLVIPYLGYVALFFQQPAGWLSQPAY